MGMYWLGLRDFLGRWIIDEAGIEGDELDLRALEFRVREGTLSPRAWLRHRFTQRFQLAGEVLFHHGRISEAEFNDWIPKPVGSEHRLAIR